MGSTYLFTYIANHRDKDFQTEQYLLRCETNNHVGQLGDSESVILICTKTTNKQSAPDQVTARHTHKKTQAGMMDPG